MNEQTPPAAPRGLHDNSTGVPELTLRGIVLGALITVVFTSSNVYLGLKVGMTFSSAIPAAVISMAALGFFARSNVLENNMVQTQASAAGTLSAVIFVLPAILMMGHWSRFQFWQTLLVCMAGGALGVVFSIPLRRTMVVNSPLPYPEGVAAAEILLAGNGNAQAAPRAQGGARDIVFGSVTAAVIGFFTSALSLLTDKTALWFCVGKAVFQVPIGFSLALTGAGYLMGLTAGIAMLIGVVLAWGGFVPWLTSQLGTLDGSVSAIATQIWSTKVRFIGAGTLAIASIWTLITLMKPMLEGIRLSIRSIAHAASGRAVERVDLDLSAQSLLLLSLALLILLGGAFHAFVGAANLPGATAWGLVLLAVAAVFAIGFFIAAACGYMAGLVGSSSSPISGIGIVAIILVSLVLMLLDSLLGLFVTPEDKRFGMALVLFITTAVLCVAAIANDNLQDLKTGHLVGATPRNQQIALLVGCVVGAIVIAPVLDLLYQAYGFNGAPPPRPGMDAALLLSAPQATLMMTITQGIFEHDLDFAPLLAGVFLGVVIIVVDTMLGRRNSRFRISALAVALGIYLPPQASMSIVVGALLNHAVKRRRAAGSGEREGAGSKRGVLIASGFIVGESLMGVALAVSVLASLSLGLGEAPFSLAGFLEGRLGGGAEMMRGALSLLVFAAVCAVFYKKSAAA